MTAEIRKPQFKRRDPEEVKEQGRNFCERVTVVEGTTPPTNVKPVKSPVLKPNKLRHNLITGQPIQDRELNPHRLQPPPTERLEVAFPQRPDQESEAHVVCNDITEALNADLSSRGVGRGGRRH